MTSLPALLLTAALAAAPAPDGRLAVLAAMEEELARGATQLRMPGHEPPYFVGYTLKEQHSRSLEARYGAIFGDSEKRDAKLAVDVRVGSYELDSSAGRDLMPFSFGDGGPAWLPSTDAPLERDPLALRNALWLLTDSKYKAALSTWLKKRGNAVYEVEEKERPPSFTREEAVRHVDAPLPVPFDRAAWRERALRLSGVFAKQPEIFDHEIRVTVEHEVRIQASSEGTRLVTEVRMYGVHIQAVARAEDGELLESSKDFYAPSEAQLPSLPELEKAARELMAELLELRVAPVIDPYSGPALLEPEATGVLFHETLGHRLEGERQDDENEGRTFKGQIGAAILPAFLSLVDDPTLRTFGSTPLNGTYAFDDEGVPAQRSVLVQDGVLRSYILSRKPVKGFSKSNGHGRAQGNRAPMARMANLVLSSKKTVSDAKLLELLLEEARAQKKPYALLIEDIAGGDTNTSTYGYQAFRGKPRRVFRIDVKTGKRQLVRGVEIVGTPLASINKIIATGDKPGIFNGYCGAESGYVPVSAIAPAALVRELELQRSAKATERGPVLPSPFSAK